ncbi:hypothetical protein CBR_g45422 [Chara braunii]|uniref:Reverse transcriptase/retrotransposon-derived protein RNase H-like domain-containing protein n=1 Tax=Chara braunii TaxID=69332 RepID=A0A388LYQ2_CHABU|nr:hypothetical protein CBR_g45422 [Chara braunii]|eukprot:GBG87362.1 hypothetical protein CBR_g45422 [Chara braunii]
MTNVAFRLGKVHALGDVVVLDVNTYDVLFGLPALVALRANLDFERRSVILRNTGGKPYVIPMRLTLRTMVKVVPRISPETMGALRMVSWNALVDGGQSSNDAWNDDDDDPVPLHWDDECDQAFGALKDALVTAPILIRPDSFRQFILITDWQPEAISAILAQKGNDGKEHVIEYASRTVSDERRNDSTPQGECYAVVWGRPAPGAPRHLAHAVAISSVVSLREGFPLRIPPSRLDYLDPRDIVDPAFYRPPYEDEVEEIIHEELAEESSEEEEENLNEDEGEPAQQQEGDEDELLQTKSEEEAEEEDSEQESGDDNDEEQANEDP